MRIAPSVVYPVGRCAFYVRLLALLGGLGLLVLAVWWWPLLVKHPQVAPRGDWLAGLAGWVLWLVWMAFAWHSWRRSPTGRLQWDALAAADDEPPRTGAWRWQSGACRDAAPLQRVDLVLDLQDRALLRLRNPDAASRWVWVERASDPARWNDLRRALVSAQA